MYLNPNLLHLLDINNELEDVSLSYLESINSILQVNFRNTINYFFSSEVINLKIISIEEQEN